MHGAASGAESLSCEGGLRNLIEEDFVERWRAVIRHVQNGAERLQATADAIPPELSPGVEANLRGLLARHTEAFTDHAVALNCLDALIADHIEGGSPIRSADECGRTST